MKTHCKALADFALLAAFEKGSVSWKQLNVQNKLGKTDCWLQQKKGRRKKLFKRRRIVRLELLSKDYAKNGSQQTIKTVKVTTVKATCW